LATIREHVAASPLASVAGFCLRFQLVAKHDARIVGQSVRWLFRSREHTNLTFDLAPLNYEHLAWFIALITDCPFQEIQGYFEEMWQDRMLASHITEATLRSKRWRLADSTPRYGLRVGWYALVRALRPNHVVETGTDKGLGSCVVAAALLRNGSGKLTTIDISSSAGYLIAGRYAHVVEMRRGDSLDLLPLLDDRIDLFFHEVHSSAEQERAEYEAISPLIGKNTVLVSDNGKSNNELARLAAFSGRQFLYFHEIPQDHWYPGGVMCAAFWPHDLAAPSG
jgi:hypothetical protein